MSVSFPADTDVAVIAKFVRKIGREMGDVGSWAGVEILGVPAACVDALRHTWSDPDGVVVEVSFSGIGRCLCVFFKRPQDH